MRTWLVFFAIGVSGVQYSAQLPGLPWALTALLAGGVATLMLYWALPEEAHWKGFFGYSLAALLLGFGYATLCAHVRLADHLPDEWEGRDVEVIGTIASLPQVGPRGVRFEFATETVLTPKARIPERIQLNWYGSFAYEEVLTEVPAVHAGERWRLTVRLKKPHGSANPHGFDYEAWLLERGVRATGYVRVKSGKSTVTNQRLNEFVRTPSNFVQAARESLRTRMAIALEGKAEAGVLVALVIGDQRAIDEADWRMFSRTGVAHLMSISGLHITMLAALAGWLTSILWRRVPRLALAVPTPRVVALVGLFTAFSYCLLAGFGVPAQRTLVMLGVVAAGYLFNWHAGPARLLLLALGAVLVLDPWAALAAGFWLSFGAVAVLLYAGVGRAPTSWWRNALRAQVAVTIGLIPATLVLFGQFSLVGPLANAIAIPLVSLLVTPLSLLGALLPPLLVLPHLLMQGLMRYLHWLDDLPLATWQHAAPEGWSGIAAVLASVVGLVWLMLPISTGWRGFVVSGRWVGVVWLLPLALLQPTRPAPGEVWVTTLDVGQGLAMVVETATKTLVYDTGPSYSEEADGGNRVVLPYLRARGVRELAGLVVTHQDNDHAGGAFSMLEELVPATLWSSLSADNLILQHGNLPKKSVQQCSSGIAWEWDGVQFAFLHPQVADVLRTDIKTNNRSCVLRVSAGGRRVLLTADIEAIAEKELLARAAAALRADVLLAPHHGSKTSSTTEFLAATGARDAVFPVGYRNRFAHPAPEVMARYEAAGMRVHRTDLDGAVVIKLGQSGVAISHQRELRKRYWQHR